MQTLLLVDDEPNIVEGLASQFEGRYGGDVIVLKAFPACTRYPFCKTTRWMWCCLTSACRIWTA